MLVQQKYSTESEDPQPALEEDSLSYFPGSERLW